MGKNKQAEPQEGWFQILEQCRELQAQKGGAFTSEDLSQFANLKGTPTTSSAAIASAWLGKFTAWGYLVRGEPIKIEGKVGRPTSTYLLTEDGMLRRGRDAGARIVPGHGELQAQEAQESGALRAVYQRQGGRQQP